MLNENIIQKLIQGDFTTMSNIYRYSGAINLKPENLAEHSYYVILLSDLISEDIKYRFPEKNIDKSKVLLYSIYHDYEEIYTGDIITPVKYKIPGFKDKLEELGEMLLNEGTTKNFEWYDYLSKHIQDQHWSYEKNKDKILENRIVKFADMFQSLIYCVKEVNLGNSTFEPTLKRQITAFIKKYSKSVIFRHYVKHLLDLIERNQLLKTNIIEVNWEEFNSIQANEE